MAETKEKSHKNSKHAMLRELEDIKDSLRSEDINIPILTDTVNDKTPPVEEQLAFDEKLIFDEADEDEEVALQFGDDSELDEEALLRAAYRETLNGAPILEGQQSLFDDDIHRTGVRQAINSEDYELLPTARGENPFLPQHIRDRLSQGKNSFLEEIAMVSASLNRNTRLSEHPLDPNRAEISPPKSSKPNLDQQILVDELVAHYLPQIEKDLRRKLLEILTNQEK